MELTPRILKSICPYASLAKLTLYTPFLNEFMPLYEIDSLLRVRHFIAQVAHESGSFNYVEEIASGQAYEGRKDLGNTNPGDGIKYKGRGSIQITGRTNYSLLTTDLGVDFVNNPELLKSPKYAVESACWFWKKHNLNEWADTDNINMITKKINGGFNGLADRMSLYKLAQKYIV